MVKRLTLLKSVAPFLALGVLVFGSASVSASEAGLQLAAATPRSRTGPRPAPAKQPSAKPAPTPNTAAATPASGTTPASGATTTAARQPVSPDAAWGQVNGERVNVRTGPSMQASILTSLHGGDFVRARAVQDGWLEIDWPQSVPAWVAKDSVKVASDAADRSGTVAGTGVRVYSAGTPRAPVLAKLDQGARVEIMGEDGAWYKIKAPGSAVAYISARYVLTGVAPASAPPANTPSSNVARQQPAPASQPREAAAKAASSDVTPKPKDDLAAIIEETRRRLKAAAIPDTAPVEPDTTPVETARAATETEKQTESQEQARLAAEAAKKAEAEEQAKREADAKRLEEAERARLAAEAAKKAEAEEQAKREADAKRLEEAERARLAAETAKKAEAEEQAKREADAKRLEEAERARLAAEAAKKAEAEEQAKREASARAAADKSDPRHGSFVDPTTVPEATAPSAPPPAKTPDPTQKQSFLDPRPEQGALPVSNVASRDATTRETASASPETDGGETAALTAATGQRPRSRFILPAQVPERQVRRAEVVRI
ncbi:MAG: SH3 domain-containing protein, partial [Planctomycetota bacterium]|nr:SH3 domain-containing protein [Planctomycetota bacterium]